MKKRIWVALAALVAALALGGWVTSNGFGDGGGYAAPSPSGFGDGGGYV